MKTKQNDTTNATAGHGLPHAGFTPGPWFVNGPWHIQADTHTEIPVIVANVVSPRGDDLATREANARLIAAAPELLEALTDMLAAFTAERPAMDDHQAHTAFCLRQVEAEDRARAAIAKATP